MAVEKKVQYLTKKLVEAIHVDVNPETLGYVSEGNLDYLIENAENFPEEMNVCPETFEEKVTWVAAHYLFHLVSSHPFDDGNKRTAFLSTSLFLLSNGLNNNYDEEKVLNYIKKIHDLVAEGKRPLEAINAFQDELEGKKEYIFIKLLFDLAAADTIIYKSPKDIYPIMKELIFKKETPESDKLKKEYLYDFWDKLSNRFKK